MDTLQRFFTRAFARMAHMAPRRRGFFSRLWRSFKRRTPQIFGFFFATFFFITVYAYFGIYTPPTSFPVHHLITVQQGASVSEVANMLQEEHVVQSSLALRILFNVLDEYVSVQAGDYLFDRPIPITEVAQRIRNGVFGLTPIRIVIPEGATTYEMAELFEDDFERITATEFLLLAEGKEGYLFPDTYFFMPNVNATEVVEMLERTFYERLEEVGDSIATFGRPVHEVVTMASLLEKEARNHEERRQIAGILWKRIDVSMPLQVDAVFGFIKRTATFNPRLSDLEVDSPYNTYKNKGLPPGPIGNPSLSALEAAVTPIETDALYYLHGRDGVMYIANTYAEHLVNRRRHLD